MLLDSLTVVKGTWPKFHRIALHLQQSQIIHTLCHQASLSLLSKQRSRDYRPPGRRPPLEIINSESCVPFTLAVVLATTIYRSSSWLIPKVRFSGPMRRTRPRRKIS